MDETLANIMPTKCALRAAVGLKMKSALLLSSLAIDARTLKVETAAQPAKTVTGQFAAQLR